MRTGLKKKKKKKNRSPAPVLDRLQYAKTEPQFFHTAKIVAWERGYVNLCRLLPETFIRALVLLPEAGCAVLLWKEIALSVRQFFFRGKH